VDSQAQAIATWAEKQGKPANKPKYDRLTRTDLGLLLKYRQQGLTQVEIAQRLGCSQGTVSKWLDDLTDSRDVAKEYLAGQSLRMAKNIVHRGIARDHIQALRGNGVLADDSGTQGIVIQIGIKDSDVTFASNTQVVTKDLHSLTDETGSDN